MPRALLGRVAVVGLFTAVLGAAMSVLAQDQTIGQTAYAQRFLELFDLNGDSKATLSEIATDQKRLFAAIDLDNDAKLSVAEFGRRGRSLQVWRTTTVFDLLDTNGDAMLTLAEIQAPTMRWFKRYDANGDGFLSANELPRQRSWGSTENSGDAQSGPRNEMTYARRFLELFDLDDDGRVSLAEIMTDQKRLFSAIDIDGNGKLSTAEVHRRGRFLQMWRTTTVFDLLDTNGDGVLTSDEIRAPTARWFKRYDRNGDGALEVSELPDARSWTGTTTTR